MHEVPALKHLKYVTVISQKKKKSLAKSPSFPTDICYCVGI